VYHRAQSADLRRAHPSRCRCCGPHDGLKGRGSERERHQQNREDVETTVMMEAPIAPRITCATLRTVPGSFDGERENRISREVNRTPDPAFDEMPICWLGSIRYNLAPVSSCFAAASFCLSPGVYRHRVKRTGAVSLNIRRVG